MRSRGWVPCFSAMILLVACTSNGNPEPGPSGGGDAAVTAGDGGGHAGDAGGDGGTSRPDAAGAGDAALPDANHHAGTDAGALPDAAGAVDAAGAGDAGGARDGGTPDSGEVDAGDADAGTGLPPGAACVEDMECASGFCGPTAEGGRACSAICEDDSQCAPGHRCTADTGGVKRCWPRATSACMPCVSNTQCSAHQDPRDPDADGHCVNASPELGSVCAADCAENACPAGFTCAQVAGRSVCLADNGLCTCRPAWDGMETACTVQNALGTCSGVRRCTSGALTACNARTPAAEQCNGLDDNCNDVTDEGGSDLCNDGVACTDDACNGPAGCVNTVVTDTCLVDGACYQADAGPASLPCQACVPAVAQDQFTPRASTLECQPADACHQPAFCTGGACPPRELVQDAYEANNARTSARRLGNRTDCDEDDASLQAILTGDADQDWFAQRMDDSFACVPDGAARVSSNGAVVQACAFSRCVNGSSASFTCTMGTASTEVPGANGCCATGVNPQVAFDQGCTCTGLGCSDDTVEMLYVVRGAPDTLACVPYTLTTAF